MLTPEQLAEIERWFGMERDDTYLHGQALLAEVKRLQSEVEETQAQLITVGNIANSEIAERERAEAEVKRLTAENAELARRAEALRMNRDQLHDKLAEAHRAARVDR